MGLTGSSISLLASRISVIFASSGFADGVHPEMS
jgi:hypothetical protein